MTEIISVTLDNDLYVTDDLKFFRGHVFDRGVKLENGRYAVKLDGRRDGEDFVVIVLEAGTAHD